MKKCPKCGAVYQDDSLKFCTVCGGPLVNAPAGAGASKIKAGGAASRQTYQSTPPREEQFQEPPHVVAAGSNTAGAPAKTAVEGTTGLTVLFVVFIAVAALAFIGFLAYGNVIKLPITLPYME